MWMWCCTFHLEYLKTYNQEQAHRCLLIQDGVKGKWHIRAMVVRDVRLYIPDDAFYGLP